jgi:hypothetical protein
MILMTVLALAAGILLLLGESMSIPDCDPSGTR